MFKKFSRTYLFWCLCATLWSTLCFVVPDFIDNPVGDWRALLSVGIYILSVGVFQFFLLFLIGANKYICSSLIPLYGLLGSVWSYYRVFYHISITPILIDAAMNTTPSEASGVISATLVIWVVLTILISILFCILRFRMVSERPPYWSSLIVLMLAASYYLAIPRLKEGLSTRFPLNVIYSVGGYISNQHKMTSVREMPSVVRADVPDSLVVIVVLGEATRADHMQLNGYERPTNPLLSSRANVISLPHIYSPYTSTTQCIPHMITRADSAHTEYAQTECSFISLFRKYNFHTAWLGNQDVEKALYDFLQEADTLQYTSAAIKQSLYSEWLDSELLSLTDSYIGSHARQLVVLHTVGSHWLYDTHVPQDYQVFQPTVTNRDIRQNTIEQIVNSYDNTIVYMDAFLNALADRLSSYPAIVLYISDHGESLGEGGRFLHAQENAPEEQYPAALVWYSDHYAEIFPDKIKALIQNKDKRYRTDYVFYSILSAAGMEAEGDCPEMNIFR